MSKSYLPNLQGSLSKQYPSSCIESANNHVEEMSKQTTTEGAKGGKRGPYKSCLVSFLFIIACVQLWAERQRDSNESRYIPETRALRAQ